MLHLSVPECGSFFTVAMARRLRKLRKIRGLTQKELASRLGMSRQEVSRLENAWLKDPSLGLTARYLRACGARWSEFADLLETIPVPRLEAAELEKADLPKAERLKLKRATEREAFRYARGIAYPLRGKPFSADRQQAAVRKMQRYRFKANLAETRVRCWLKEKGIGAYDRFKYLMFARRVMSALALSEGDERREKLRAAFESARRTGLRKSVCQGLVSLLGKAGGKQ